MSKLTLVCRTATTFSTSGAIDEDAMRKYLQRFVDVNIGVYIGSGGSGEGHALTPVELRRMYKVGVEVCKGKVPVNASPPEQHSARATREHTLLAIEAGMDVVSIYGPTASHGFQPTDAEIVAYFDTVLSSIKHPVAVAIDSVIGYVPKPQLIANICHRHKQIVAIVLASVGDMYLIDLKDLIERDIEYYVQLTGTPHTLTLGAAGIVGGDLNIIPKTFRRYADVFESKDFDELAVVYAQIRRCIQYLRDPRWFPSTPRGIKLAMKVLKLPGGEGGLREPYQMPPAHVIDAFTEGLLRLRVPEIEEAARAAGLTIPA